MRIKLEFKEPLEPRKILYPVPESSTVKEIIKRIYQDFSIKSKFDKKPRLLIDGFELLPSNLAEDVLRESDIITQVPLYY